MSGRSRAAGGGRKPGSKDTEKRSRPKASDTKLKRNAEQRAGKLQTAKIQSQQAGKAAHQSFFGGGSSTSAAPGSHQQAPEQAAASRPSIPPSIPPIAVAARQPIAVAAHAEILASGVGAAPAAPRPAAPNDGSGAEQARPQDVHAELHDDDGDVDDDHRASSEHHAPESSVMGEYLKGVYQRLHSETTGPASRDSSSEPWLLNMLQKKEADYWLKASFASTVCEKLGIVHQEPAYYRDIKVWLPDLQWGREATPPCVQCGSAKHVGVHGYRDNHFGRRVVGLTENYFVISRRYICKCCEKTSHEAKRAAMAVAAAHGVRVSDDGEEDCASSQHFR